MNEDSDVPDLEANAITMLGSEQTFELTVGRVKASEPRSERTDVFMYNTVGPRAPSSAVVDRSFPEIDIPATRPVSM